jgi:ABC-2 type transport system ATP-binding protein
MPSLEINKLCKRYRDFVLGPIDLALEPGMVHGLIGANGAGKSTLFRCLMGVLKPDQGNITFNGQLADPDATHWKQSIGYVGDYTPLFENWSGARNLRTLARFYENYDEKQVDQLAAKFDLNLDQLASTYSTGQRNKLAIIHALAHGAQFLLLDEPTSGLDPLARDTFMEVLCEQMGRQELTILYATHYVTEIEPLADKLLFIRDGQLLGRETKDELAQHWRKFTFRSAGELGALPGQVALKMASSDSAGVVSRNSTMDYEVISSNGESTRLFLEHAGVQRIETSRLSLEQICVQILKAQTGRQA